MRRAQEWTPPLPEEVNSLCTDLSPDPVLIEDVLDSHWGLTGVTVIERLQTYSTRQVRRITSDQGRFAVKVDYGAALVNREIGHVQAAVARALPRHVPMILPDRSGAFVVVNKGLSIAVHEDIDGGRPSSSAYTWSRLGALLATLHSLPPDPRPFAIPLHAAVNELSEHAAGYAFATQFRMLAERLRRIGGHPAATIHGEVNLSNVLQRSTGDLVLVDWDQAGAGPVALDLGYPLICVFLEEDLSWHPNHAAAFYSTYRDTSTSVLPAPEQIFDAALLHAMRYLRFANTPARWARVKHAVSRENELTEMLRNLMVPS